MEPTVTVSTSVEAPAADQQPEQSDEPDGLPRSKPVHVRIPGIGVNTDVMTVGRQTDNTIEVPPLGKEVTGWYQHGPTPGEVGPAVIVGHVDSREGPSVFWRLGELKPGDVVKIERADGKQVVFTVDSVRKFDRDKFPTKKVYGNLDHAGLRLITCGGSFDRDSRQYSHNTVVFASMDTD